MFCWILIGLICVWYLFTRFWVGCLGLGFCPVDDELGFGVGLRGWYNIRFCVWGLTYWYYVDQLVLFGVCLWDLACFVRCVDFY